MMNLLKKYLALLLAVVFCLSLAACGGSDDPVEETMGDDWRNSGVVVDSGTITHTGEGSVYVLVTVDENSAAFYRDASEQILFDSVSLPMTIPDAQEYFNDISFDDINGDGESDVSLSFVYAPGDSISLVWIWDSAARYVYREDLSVLTNDSGDISDYVGLWEYVDEDVWIRIFEDETWECLDAQGNAFQSGTLSVDSTGITFYSDDFEEVPHFDRTVSGDLIDAENNGLLVPVDDIPSNNSGDISEYVGLWGYVDENLWLMIYENETWEFLNNQEVATAFGSLWVDEDGITLYFDDTGDVVMQLDRTVSGDLIDSESGRLLVPAYDIPSNNSGDISEYVGLWEYEDINLWLRIYEDGTWAFFNDQEDVIQSGTLWVDEDGITLYFDGTDDVLQLDCSMSDCLIDCEDGSMLVPADSIQSRMPYFTRYGLEINAVMDTGTYLLKNGVCSYSSSGTGYSTGDCYWEAMKNYDYTHDGIREIQFDAICYIPQSSIGSFQETQIVAACGLCDFHTGAWFPAKENHGNSERGDNYYLFTFDWNGESVTIEFAYSSDWQFYVGEWIGVLTMSYVVYITEGYDGLIFVTEPEPLDHSAYEKRQQMVTTADTIMEVETLDPYGCLFFRVCD